jgi:hypothetical protein
MTDGMNFINDIIRSDETELARLGIDPIRVADKLESLLDVAKDGLESPVRLGGMTIRAQWDRGLISCPIGEPGLFPKIAAELTFSSGVILRYSALSIHLIRAHGFFGEPGKLFRIEPADLILLLD